MNLLHFQSGEMSNGGADDKKKKRRIETNMVASVSYSFSKSVHAFINTKGNFGLFVIAGQTFA